MTPASALPALLMVLSPLAPAGAEASAEWSTEDSARWDLENALRMWRDGLYGGLLFYHDGKGPLGPRLYADMDSPDGQAARPAEWDLTTIDCPSETECAATALIQFSNEATGGLRRYRLVRKPGQFWGLYSEERLECPAGYRLQYQGVCFNVADEQTNEPDLEIRTAEPVAAD
jgi:hypothetical protein